MCFRGSCRITQSFVSNSEKISLRKPKIQRRRKEFTAHLIEMISKAKEKLITINLDGKEVEVPAGMNLIDAATLHGQGNSSLLLSSTTYCRR